VLVFGKKVAALRSLILINQGNIALHPRERRKGKKRRGRRLRASGLWYRSALRHLQASCSKGPRGWKRGGGKRGGRENCRKARYFIPSVEQNSLLTLSSLCLPLRRPTERKKKRGREGGRRNMSQRDNFAVEDPGRKSHQRTKTKPCLFAGEGERREKREKFTHGVFSLRVRWSGGRLLLKSCS